VSERAGSNRPARRFRPIITWLALLVVLTVGGSAWLNAEGLSYQDFSPAILLVAYAPLIAAVVAAGLERGGIRALLTQFLRWKVRVRWYALAILGPLLLVLVATALCVAFGAAVPLSWLVVPPLTATPALLGPIVAGSLGEEPGWRGFAQPHLQQRFPALAAAVIVGIVWALWHLWPALTTELSVADDVQTIVRLVSTAVIYGWLYNSTGGSLPIVMVAHAAHNIAIDLLPAQVIGTSLGAWTVASLYGVAAIAVILGTNARSPRRPCG
jgi:membrane protease YdiL (CAAX protease family)